MTGKGRHVPITLYLPAGRGHPYEAAELLLDQFPPMNDCEIVRVQRLGDGWKVDVDIWWPEPMTMSERRSTP